ncbi:MAG: PLP-dependent aminotransferase family protein [Synechococcales cyanobacterium RM1_1_8]|nr:PLP-dependent aminotransferase family protein [Synechococcales cyanobacterium RM1_1_8]
MELALTLDSDLAQPLHRQIYEQIRDRILSGQLARSQRLPPSRALAQSLQVSRATVSLSYDQLLSEGYLETRPGAGTFVAAQLPEALLQVEGHPSAPVLEAIPLRLSRYGQAIALAPPWQNQPAAPYNFRYGHPSLELFPLPLWKRLMAQEMSAHRRWMDYATDPLGYGPLREAIAQYLTRARAVTCHPDQIVITHGTQQALQLVTQLFIDPGEAIALENPGYLGAQRIFRSRGALLQPVPVDGDGLIVSALAQLQPIPKLIYVTPSHQFPTGALLSLPRRLQLLDWAQQHHCLILEDDYDGEFRYSSRPIPALQGLKANAPVLYLGTFAKVLFPGLHLGYAVVPTNLVQTFAQARWLSDRHCSLLDQAVLARFITEGHLERHLRRMRLCYDRRRQILMDALKANFGDRVTILGDSAGLHLVARLHSGLCDQAVVDRAAQAGVYLASLQDHNLQSCQGDFILGYSEVSEAQIETGIQRWAAALHRWPKTVIGQPVIDKKP